MSTLFFDIDSQLDFLYPSGALYVPGAERIVPAIARLNRYASERGIPVISTTDAHAEDDVEFRQWPHHCVAATLGQRKAEETLLAQRVVIPNRDCELSLEGARQIVIEKQTVDVFAARGLLKLGKPVTIVTDAIETRRAEDSARALAEMRAGGAILSSVDEILAAL